MVTGCVRERERKGRKRRRGRQGRREREKGCRKSRYILTFFAVLGSKQSTHCSPRLLSSDSVSLLQCSYSNFSNKQNHFTHN